MCDAIVAALEHDDEEGNRWQPHLEEDVRLSLMCSARTALEIINFNFGRALRDGGQTDLRTIQ